MAFWGVWFLLRINLVTGCSLPSRGGGARLGLDTERTNSLTGGKHPIENSVEIYLCGGGFGLRRIALPRHMNMTARLRCRRVAVTRSTAGERQ